MMSNHKFIYSILFSHRIILLLGIVILFSGCANEDEPEQGSVNRTVLIYMLSNNNLGSTYRFDTQNINDMLQVAASGGLNGGNLIIYRDGYDTNPQLIQIRKNESGSAEKAIIKEYPDRNSATTEVMRSVIDETKELFPAKEYGLILWSHSTGWAPGNSSLALSPARRYELPTRSFGQDGKNYMENVPINYETRPIII
ncbi:clostripain-related cysteine peptidase [Barnesiella intestinihominis]|uniref:clostripain-related cysteine peptidase n=1 Tax=Barnesiella intestinihominis TaxID=487174 RepID=UPI003AF0E7A9